MFIVNYQSHLQEHAKDVATSGSSLADVWYPITLAQGSSMEGQRTSPRSQLMIASTGEFLTLLVFCDLMLKFVCFVLSLFAVLLHKQLLLPGWRFCLAISPG